MPIWKNGRRSFPSSSAAPDPAVNMPSSSAAHGASARPSTAAAWWLAIRPGTLSVSVAPVLAGSALAWSEAGQYFPAPFVAALAAALLIQIGTNLHNDVGDFERGADSGDRLGPPRATASGWLAARDVRRAALLSFAAAFAIGLYLVWHGGWPILAIGVLSIASGLAYTGGPRPIAYGALGEVFVWLFFGLGAVMGSYYLQAGGVSWSAFLAANALGALAAAVMVANNARDLESDRRAGKNTLAVRIGRDGARVEYAVLLVLPYALLLPLGLLASRAWTMALPLATLPWALWLVARFRREPTGPGYNQLLAQTAQLQLTFALLLSIAAMV